MINKEGSFANLIGLKGPIFERRVRQLECCSKSTNVSVVSYTRF